MMMFKENFINDFKSFLRCFTPLSLIFLTLFLTLGFSNASQKALHKLEIQKAGGNIIIEGNPFFSVDEKLDQYINFNSKIFSQSQQIALSALISSKTEFTHIVVKGIDPLMEKDNHHKFFEDIEKNKNILFISRNLANCLHIQDNEQVSLLFKSSNNNVFSKVTLNSKIINKIKDKNIGYIHIDFISRFLDDKNPISTISLNVYKEKDIKKVKEEIDKIVKNNLKVSNYSTKIKNQNSQLNNIIINSKKNIFFVFFMLFYLFSIWLFFSQIFQNIIYFRQIKQFAFGFFSLFYNFFLKHFLNAFCLVFLNFIISFLLIHFFKIKKVFAYYRIFDEEFLRYFNFHFEILDLFSILIIFILSLFISYLSIFLYISSKHFEKRYEAF